MDSLDLTTRERMICLTLSAAFKNETVPGLLEHVSAAKLFSLTEKEMRRLGLLRKSKKFETLDTLRQKKDEVLKKCQEENIKVVTILDDDYPKPLASIYNPPLVLFYKGILPEYDFQKKVFLAFIGSRKSDEELNLLAQSIANEFSLQGGHVVSGLAYGIDAYSHKGACLAQKPNTAVVANGLDIYYPFSNRHLYRSILDSGGIIFSEYPPGEQALPYRFQARNRIIAGLAEGIFVVQSPKKSGTKITVNHGLDNGRDIYVYANYDREKTHEKMLGNEEMLENGGIPVYGKVDFFKKIRALPGAKLFEEAGLTPSAEDKRKVEHNPLSEAVGEQAQSIKNPLQKNLLSLIEKKPQSVNELAALLEIESEKLNREMLSLKLDGLVKELPNKKYFINQ